MKTKPKHQKQIERELVKALFADDEARIDVLLKVLNSAVELRLIGDPDVAEELGSEVERLPAQSANPDPDPDANPQPQDGAA